MLRISYSILLYAAEQDIWLSPVMRGTMREDSLLTRESENDSEGGACAVHEPSLHQQQRQPYF
jgi:hypothetical protein